MAYGVFLSFVDVIERDLVRVVEDLGRNGKMLESFNSTFIVNIPKVENPKAFEFYGPNSLYNNIYKTI
jgi:hypothetical protein